jgi:plastocyanin
LEKSSPSEKNWFPYRAFLRTSNNGHLTINKLFNQKLTVMNQIIKRIMLITIAIAVPFLISCNGDDPQAVPGENEIWMRNNQFVPNNLVISPGTTITWINRENVIHNTISDDGLWDSGPMSLGDTHTFTFTDEGIYDYRCTFHPPGMVGRITVQ